MRGTDRAGALRARLKSLRHAIDGLAFVLATQPNAKIHLAVAIGVGLAGLVLGVGREDWLWLGLAVAIVWIAETLNTAVEHLCDVVSPEPHPSVKRAKDVAAGAVLIASVTAAAIGTAVFLPRIAHTVA